MRFFISSCSLLLLCCLLLEIHAASGPPAIHRRVDDANLLSVPSSSNSGGTKNSKTPKDPTKAYPGHNRCSPGVAGSMGIVETQGNGFCILHDPKVKYNDGWYPVACSEGKACQKMGDTCHRIKQTFKRDIIDCRGGTEKKSSATNPVGDGTVTPEGPQIVVEDFSKQGQSHL